MAPEEGLTESHTPIVEADLGSVIPAAVEDTTESTLTAPAAPAVPPVEPPTETAVAVAPEPEDPHTGQYWDPGAQIWRPLIPAPEPIVDRTGQHWDVGSQQWIPDEVSL
jgi:hypothetical protein